MFQSIYIRQLNFNNKKKKTFFPFAYITPDDATAADAMCVQYAIAYRVFYLRVIL